MSAPKIVEDYIEEARSSLDIYYEFHQPGVADNAAKTRLLESMAESLVSIARSLDALVPGRH